ncbi:MAG: hypothetical protein M3R68_07910 [Acidobacteriota bacterium]|nr:hypothetical protein [Acidobacteriota bacterium]
MSTLAYAALTTSREQSAANTSTSPPGVSTYVDAVAALVPAEVLTLHALILSVTTETLGGSTKITAVSTLSWAFFGLTVLSAAVFVAPRLLNGEWDRLDYIRAAIPALSFVGWTMLQRTTAFDAVAGQLGGAPRTVIALFLAFMLGPLAAALASKADQKPPPP